MEYQLKNRKSVTIRKPTPEDAEAIVNVMTTADTETRFLARNPGEFCTSVERERELIINILNDNDVEWFVAEYESKVVGQCSVGLVRRTARYRHRAEVAFVILKEYCGLGIGGKMMEECIKWCRDKGVTQMELDVVKDNDRALKMYRDFGFEISGIISKALRYQDGTYADEYRMINTMLSRERVLRRWGFTEIEILEQFNKDLEQFDEAPPRLIFKVQADGNLYILKGIPISKPESVILGNTLAHEYLGNRKGIAPRIINLPEGSVYTESDGYRFYLIEFIEGKPMEPTVESEEQLGRLAKQLHSFTDYTYLSGLDENKQRFYEWFSEKPFKPEFDAVLDSIPDFGKYDRCFIHTDLGPHNTIIRADGELVLIDLDDAGIGSRYLDLGYAFIMQFVEHTEDMQLSYRFDLAKAFLAGYYGDGEISRSEYDLVWQGAVFMHISYMQSYGCYAVDSLWEILKFGWEQKEKLWELLTV